jgi:hypothetical protein
MKVSNASGIGSSGAYMYTTRRQNSSGLYTIAKLEFALLSAEQNSDLVMQTKTNRLGNRNVVGLVISD